MPHSTDTHACPYCGYPLRDGEVTCSGHRDLPALEQLDDRYLLREDQEP